MEILLPKGLDPTKKNGIYSTEDGKKWRVCVNKSEYLCALWDNTPTIKCVIGVKKNVRTKNHNVILVPENYKA